MDRRQLIACHMVERGWTAHSGSKLGTFRQLDSFTMGQVELTMEVAEGWLVANRVLAPRPTPSMPGEI